MESHDNSRTEEIYSELKLARLEIKNLRQECLKQKAILQSEIVKIKNVLQSDKLCGKRKCLCEDKNSEKNFLMKPIGYVSSCFKNKNGIPRQSSLCPGAKGTLTIEKDIFTNPEHSLLGLNEFSHIWILFVFHENGKCHSVKSKVHPPRLNGSSVGVFSTRSPHRPCAIGLSLIKLDKIEGSTLHLSGIDLLHGTPVLDIKPYIPLYDIPPTFTANKRNASASPDDRSVDPSPTREESSETSPPGEFCVASYLQYPQKHLQVLFTTRALADLGVYHPRGSHLGDPCPYCMTFGNAEEALESVSDVLQNDPRSTYRRQKCTDRLYYFRMGGLHVTCWFDEDVAEVLRVKPMRLGVEFGDFA